MTTIVLIRHGQASFGQACYDALSPLGEEQARVLGRSLASLGPPVEAVYCGDQQRQRQTAAALLESAGWRVDPQLHPGFNEFDFEAVLRSQLPAMIVREPALAEDIERLTQDRGAFKRVFEGAMLRWVSGRHDDPGVESWPAFTRRVVAALAPIAATHARGERVLVCTSGGPIAALVGHLLGLAPETALRLNWQILNASCTRLRCNREGLALAGFNCAAHLEALQDPRWLTYR
jgi:broad specificity phosphatase PhoE